VGVSYERGTPVNAECQIRRVGGRGGFSSSLSSLLLPSLELSDTKVYEPSIRARLGTASHFCLVVVLKLRTKAGGSLGQQAFEEPEKPNQALSLSRSLSHTLSLSISLDRAIYLSISLSLYLSLLELLRATGEGGGPLSCRTRHAISLALSCSRSRSRSLPRSFLLALALFLSLCISLSTSVVFAISRN